jgi:uncharacterized membrane protein
MADKKGPEREIFVDKMGLAFAKIMTIFTVIGIVLMVVPAIAYFMGINPYVPLTEAHKYWRLSATNFWLNVTGKPITGYSWIFSNLDKMDCLSMIGVIVLMVTPLLAMLAGVVKAEDKTYRTLLLIAAIEFIASILVKSLLAAAGGAKKLTKVKK